MKQLIKVFLLILWTNLVSCTVVHNESLYCTEAAVPEQHVIFWKYNYTSTLTCNDRGTEVNDGFYNWNLTRPNGERISITTNSTQYTIHTRFLTISNINDNDAGLYVCSGKFQGQALTEVNVTFLCLVTVASPVISTFSFNNPQRSENQMAILQLSITYPHIEETDGRCLNIAYIEVMFERGNKTDSLIFSSTLNFGTQTGVFENVEINGSNVSDASIIFRRVNSTFNGTYVLNVFGVGQPFESSNQLRSTDSFVYAIPTAQWRATVTLSIVEHSSEIPSSIPLTTSSQVDTISMSTSQRNMSSATMEISMSPLPPSMSPIVPSNNSPTTMAENLDIRFVLIPVVVVALIVIIVALLVLIGVVIVIRKFQVCGQYDPHKQSDKETVATDGVSNTNFELSENGNSTLKNV